MKKTVFISSTYQDLADHRRAIWQVLERFDADVRGMEQFGARTEAPIETCVAEVEQADVYVGVIGFRLGSIDSHTSKSFTQVEYERALQLGKSILIYLADEDTARVRYTDIELDPQARQRLAAFKATLRERHTVSTFSTPEDLAEKIKRDFARELEPKEPTPESNEFTDTETIVKRFMLLPQTVIGREVRVRVGFYGGVFAASRALCGAFNLPYGATVGSFMRVTAPEGDAKKFREMYATGPSVDQFLALAQAKGPADVYALLQFCERDIGRIKGEFFGYSYYYDEHDDPGDPSEQYVSPEGKAMLLFSKDAA